MISFSLLTKFQVPAGMPATVEEVLADSRAIDRQRDAHNPYERDAYDHSGKRSHALFSASLASAPTATSGLPSDVKEDDSARTHEAASQLVGTVGSAARQAFTTVVPAVAAIGAGLSFGGSGGGGGTGGTKEKA